jgi:hypothetical protein
MCTHTYTHTQEEIPLHEKNIYAIVFYKEQNCLITGGEDMTIQMYYLSGEVPLFNDVPLPTSFTVRVLKKLVWRWAEQGRVRVPCMAV